MNPGPDDDTIDNSNGKTWIWIPSWTSLRETDKSFINHS